MKINRAKYNRFQRILGFSIVFGAVVIVIVPVDFSGWLTALLRISL